MQKMLHKLIRYRRAGVNVVADINAAVVSGEDGVSTATVHSRSRIVQRNGRAWVETDDVGDAGGGDAGESSGEPEQRR